MGLRPGGGRWGEERGMGAAHGTSGGAGGSRASREPESDRETRI